MILITGPLGEPSTRVMYAKLGSNVDRCASIKPNVICRSATVLSYFAENRAVSTGLV